ncbi:hypothetical protein [Cytobacillus praedii]|uniref:hypothetical protein n=1 Tax=Cytobacillus praedii TaxID=1742358 RepID=UPI002E22D4C7|nr:hypothetical protein [Cytobacillus praedii]
MILFLEILRAVASVLLIISAGFYLRYLEKTKRQRKLAPLELIICSVFLIKVVHQSGALNEQGSQNYQTFS